MTDDRPLDVMLSGEDGTRKSQVGEARVNAAVRGAIEAGAHEGDPSGMEEGPLRGSTKQVRTLEKRSLIPAQL